MPMHAFDNRVTKHTGTEFPVFQAPIGFISRSELVGAVSAAGGVGLLELGSLSVPKLQEQYDQVRARSNRPFGFHYLIGALGRRPEHEAAVLDWGLDGKTSFVTTGYGDPTKYIGRFKDAGVIAYHLTDTLEEALRAEDAGYHGVILAGAEKGGGSGRDNLHTFALLQKARRRLGIPIVASGGIVDGYGMAAAFALGAEGVWMGTRFIASAECPWHDNYKEAITSTDRVIHIDTARPEVTMLAVRNEFAEAVSRGEAGDTKIPYAGDAMKLFYEGRTDLALVGCGESAVLIDEVKPAGQIVRDTVREFWEEMERLSRLLPAPARASAGA